MENDEINKMFDSLRTDLNELSGEIKSFSGDIAEQQKRNYKNLASFLSGVAIRAERNDWSQVDCSVRGHPVKSFIHHIEIFNKVALRDKDIAVLRQRFMLTGKKLAEKKLLSEAELNALMERVNNGRN